VTGVMRRREARRKEERKKGMNERRNEKMFS